jgi:hypothetical protein
MRATSRRFRNPGRLGLGLALITFVHAASFAAWAAPRDLYHRQAVIPGSGLSDPYPLPDQRLIENSEQVIFHDSLLAREADYRMDYLRGLIRFNRILTVSDTAYLTYQIFPFELRTSYFHPLQTLRPDQIAQADTLKPATTPATASMFDTGSLRKSGTLVRGITIGSDRDLSVESGLNLQVEGRLGRDLDVLALLSDQNTPLQPEGNTATLQEIDKVLIQLQSTHFGATLGDYELEFSGPRFGSYYRKLQGARLDGRTTDDSLTISGAVSKGQYHSNSLLGQEGNQGPYRLTDKEGRAGILVLAGTERVYLDGRLLTRGANNDYTIEYGLGEITFTPQRLITSDSRLTVDFQYSAESYGRDIYSARGEANFGRRAGLRTTVISESDARTDPLSFVLTGESEAALSSAADDPAAAYTQQIDSVAVGEGDYRREMVGGDTIFVWAGSDSNGYLNVVFSYVGFGQGSYARQASAQGFYYFWVGPGEGDYDPVLRLPLPERRRLLDAEVWADPTRTSRLKFEGAVSEWDANTFSSQDDGDNVGFAWSADGHWSLTENDVSTEAARASPLEVDATVRRVEERFTEIDRTQQVEYARQWNLDEASSTGESVQEAALTVRPVSLLTSKALYGRLNKEVDGFRSERWRGETNLAGTGLPVINAQAEWIRSHSDQYSRDGFWTRGLTTARYTYGRFTPNLRYEREHKHDSYSDSLSGFLFNVYGVGLDYTAGPLMLSTAQERRDDQKYREEVLRDFSLARTQNYKVDLQSWKALSGNALYTHRRKSYDSADSADVLTDLAEINLGWKPWNRLVDLLAHYRVSNTQVSSIVQIPVFVGAGQGTHVQVGDLFFEDPDGDYILVAQSTGQFQPVVDLEANFSLDLDPGRLPTAAKDAIAAPWKHLASEPDVWAIYRLDWSRFQGDSTLSGSILLREDLFLFRQRRDLNLRLRGELSNSVSNLYLTAGQETKRRLVSLRLRRSFSDRWSTQFDLERETDQRIYLSSSASSRDILSWSGSVEPVYRPKRVWEIGLRMLGQRERDAVEGILAWRYGMEPRIVRSFTEKGRAELRGEWHRVTTDVEDLPYELASGDPPGDNFRWDLSLDYRLSKYLTAGVSYNGSKDAGREAIHIGRAEVRAFF